MKFSNLVRSEDGKVVHLELDMSDGEAQFFVSWAFNALLAAGLARLNEQTGSVELSNVTKPESSNDANPVPGH